MSFTALGQCWEKTWNDDPIPPLFHAELERLAADCAACSAEAPWRYRGKTLTLNVADDVVACLRQYAYPFFEKYASLQGLIDASKVGFVGFAFALFAPIVRVQLERVDDARTYAENWLRRLPQDEIGMEYREFFKTLFKMIT